MFRPSMSPEAVADARRGKQNSKGSDTGGGSPRHGGGGGGGDVGIELKEFPSNK